MSRNEEIDEASVFRSSLEMEREIKASVLVVSFMFLFSHIHGNLEGDALHKLRSSLSDPSNALQSWDPTLINPCTWHNITCNSDNSVVRVDLGNAGLSGRLVPELGLLKNLQYLELYKNNLSGRIPSELGNLTNLVSLDLYLNNFTGSIPDSLGNLKKLRFLTPGSRKCSHATGWAISYHPPSGSTSHVCTTSNTCGSSCAKIGPVHSLDKQPFRLNNNSLSGHIPMSLTAVSTLQVLDLSSNRLSGEVPSNGSFALFTPFSFANNKHLCGWITGKPCPGSPPF